MDPLVEPPVYYGTNGNANYIDGFGERSRAAVYASLVPRQLVRPPTSFELNALKAEIAFRIDFKILFKIVGNTKHQQKKVGGGSRRPFNIWVGGISRRPTH